MASFYIRVNEAHAQADELGRYVNEIGNAISAAESIRNSLEIGQVYSRLQTSINELYSERQKMSKMQGKLNAILEQYGNTELRIINNVQSGAGTGNAGTDGDGTGTGNAGTGGNDADSDTGNDISFVQALLKAWFDMGGEAGSLGKTGGLINALLKMAVDGDGFTISDIGELIKGSGGSVLGILDLIEHYNGNDWQKMIGWNTYAGFSTNATAGWLARMKDTFKSTIDDQLNVFKTGTRELDCPKLAGWALSFIANGFSNAEECYNQEISGGRAVAETITETLVDVGKGALITLGITAGIAAVGASAPAIVVAGAGVVVSAGLDWICEQITGEPLTEVISDGILDGLSAAGDAITGALSSAGDAICGWWDKVQLAW